MLNLKLMSGFNIFLFLKDLRNLNIKCDEAVVFLDREQGGLQNLLEKGVNVKPVIKLTQVGFTLASISKC